MRLSEIGSTLSEWRLALLIAGSVLVFVLLWGGDAIRPGSFNRAGLRNVNPLPPPVWLLAACMVWLAVPLAASAFNEMPGLTGGEGSVRAVAAPTALAYLVGIAVAVGMVYMAHKAVPQGGMKLDWIDLPVGSGLLLLCVPFIMLAGDLARLVHASLAGEADISPIAHPTLDLITQNRADPWTWALIAGAVIGAPIVEEIVFRVFLQSALFRVLRHAWAGVIVTAIIFGVLHAIPMGESQTIPWYAAVQIGVLGLCCGAAFERTKHVGVPIAMHMTFNAANIAIAMWMASNAA